MGEFSNDGDIFEEQSDLPQLDLVDRSSTYHHIASSDRPQDRLWFFSNDAMVIDDTQTIADENEGNAISIEYTEKEKTPNEELVAGVENTDVDCGEVMDRPE